MGEERMADVWVLPHLDRELHSGQAQVGQQFTGDVRGRGLRQGQVTGGTYQNTQREGVSRARTTSPPTRPVPRLRNSYSILRLPWEGEVPGLSFATAVSLETLPPAPRSSGRPRKWRPSAYLTRHGGSVQSLHQLQDAPRKSTRSFAAAIALTSSLGGFSWVFPNSPMAY